MRALLRLSPGRNILGYSNLLRLLEQGFPENGFGIEDSTRSFE